MCCSQCPPCYLLIHRSFLQSSIELQRVNSRPDVGNGVRPLLQGTLSHALQCVRMADSHTFCYMQGSALQAPPAPVWVHVLRCVPMLTQHRPQGLRGLAMAQPCAFHAEGSMLPLAGGAVIGWTAARTV
jgi:hypothetical protein